MGDIIVNARVLEQCRTTGGDDDYDLIDYTFSGYVKAIDAINHICEDKHKHMTFEFETSGEFDTLEPIIFFFERNEKGEFICNNVPDHKTARELLREIRCNWMVAKKMREHVWITIKDWKVIKADA